MADAGAISHDDAYFGSDNRDRLDARAMGENVARNATIDGAHRALMASEHHRANILDRRFAVIGFGAVFKSGWWWVTEDFLEPRRVAGRSRSAARSGRSVERARGEHAVPSSAEPSDASADAGDVLAAMSPAPSPLEPDSSRERLRSPVLAGDDVVNPMLTLGASAVAFSLLGALVLLRRATRSTSPPASDEVSHEDVAIDHRVGPFVLEANNDVAGRGLPQRLSVIHAWVRTLDDRWETLSESDKRVAMQIIRRNTEAALHEMPEMMGASR